MREKEGHTKLWTVSSKIHCVGGGGGGGGGYISSRHFFYNFSSGLVLIVGLFHPYFQGYCLYCYYCIADELIREGF